MTAGNDAASPVIQLLSNGRYHVMVTSAGGGYSSWQHLALTRWREDPTCDDWGSFCYLRDVASGETWSTAGAGDPQRTRMAMDALDQQLIERDAALVRLLAPPFNQSNPNPGYIQGYLRGVRENGGQYTHAAVWAAMAFVAIGDGGRAWEIATMINPINHARTQQASAVFMTEPYVLAADVYAIAPHTGRGGWTWYTGSAGWMYRLLVESLLGLRIEGDTLQIAPCLPVDWTAYKLQYRYRDTCYHVRVAQTLDQGTGQTVHADGIEARDGRVHLVDDRQDHRIAVTIHRPRDANRGDA